MPSQIDTGSRASAPRRSARDIVEAVLHNMRQNLEPLKYSTLAPTRYLVYLHPTEFKRLEGILRRVRLETIRALTDELDAINQQSRVLRKVRSLLGRSEAPVEGAGTEWQVEFLPDPDGELAVVDILGDSERLLPPQPELRAGERTRRITTGRVGQRPMRQEDTVKSRPSSTPAAVGRLAYTDDEGPHTFEIAKDSVLVGRGGIAYRVDVRIKSAVDVSREHARIRRDPLTGSYFLIDLSTLGTSLDGQRIPKGYDEADGSKRENGVEVPLPPRARIGLADMVYLEFEAVKTS
jgi:hypothetical protein